MKLPFAYVPWRRKEFNVKVILVGTDGSDESMKAVRFAGQLARDTGAHLSVVHAKETPWQWTPEYGAEHMLAASEEIARRTEKRVGEELATIGIPFTFQARNDYPPDAIDDAADDLDADVIVVGSRGHSPAKRLLLGSVSTRLVHRSHRPVLVVP